MSNRGCCPKEREGRALHVKKGVAGIDIGQENVSANMAPRFVEYYLPIAGRVGPKKCSSKARSHINCRVHRLGNGFDGILREVLCRIKLPDLAGKGDNPRAKPRLHGKGVAIQLGVGQKKLRLSPCFQRKKRRAKASRKSRSARRNMTGEEEQSNIGGKKKKKDHKV